MKQKGNLVKSLLCTKIENMGRKLCSIKFCPEIYEFCIPLYFAMQWKSKVAFIHIQLSKFQIWPIIPGLSGLLNINCRFFPIQWVRIYLVCGRQGLNQTSFKVILHKRHWCWPNTFFLPFLNCNSVTSKLINLKFSVNATFDIYFISQKRYFFEKVLLGCHVSVPLLWGWGHLQARLKLCCRFDVSG